MRRDSKDYRFNNTTTMNLLKTSSHSQSNSSFAKDDNSKRRASMVGAGLSLLNENQRLRARQRMAKNSSQKNARSSRKASIFGALDRFGATSSADQECSVTEFDDSITSDLHSLNISVHDDGKVELNEEFPIKSPEPLIKRLSFGSLSALKQRKRNESNRTSPRKKPLKKERYKKASQAETLAVLLAKEFDDMDC